MNWNWLKLYLTTMTLSWCLSYSVIIYNYLFFCAIIYKMGIVTLTSKIPWFNNTASPTGRAEAFINWNLLGAYYTSATRIGANITQVKFQSSLSGIPELEEKWTYKKLIQLSIKSATSYKESLLGMDEEGICFARRNQEKSWNGNIWAIY